MASQPLSAVKITVARELIEKAASSNETWRELYEAIQNHPGVEILPQAQIEGDAQWPAA